MWNNKISFLFSRIKIPQEVNFPGYNLERIDLKGNFHIDFDFKWPKLAKLAKNNLY